MSRLSCIVICSEQQHAQAECSAYALLAQGADTVVVVANKSRNLHGVDWITSTPPFSGFSAGYNRDVGIQHVVANYGPSDFLFIDGDCMPSPGLVAHHRRVLQSNAHVLSCGLRINKSTSGTLTVDRRLGHPATRMRLFARGFDRVLVNPKEVLTHSAVWSCNLGASWATVLAVTSANKLASFTSSEPRMFHPCFDGNWGGEDTLVGIVGFRTGAQIVLMDPDVSHVVHTDHPSNAQGNSGLQMCWELDRVIREQLPASAELIVSSTAGRLVPDTKAFYENIVSVRKNDARVVSMASILDVSDAGGLFVLNFLFSSNPSVQHTEAPPTAKARSERVLELFNTARSKVFTVQDLR